MVGLLKFVPTILGWFGSRVKLGAEKTRAALERQAAIADGWAPQIIVFFWFWPFIAAYIPWAPLQDSAAAGLAALENAPEYHFELLMGITAAVLGVKRARRK